MKYVNKVHKKNVKIKPKDSSNLSISIASTSNSNYLNKIKEELKYLSNEDNYEKILNHLELLLKSQELTQKDMQLGFIELAKQNSELLNLNKELNKQLEIVTSELNQIKKERENKSVLREKRLNRKRLSKRSPMNSEI